MVATFYTSKPLLSKEQVLVIPDIVNHTINLQSFLVVVVSDGSIYIYMRNAYGFLVNSPHYQRVYYMFDPKHEYAINAPGCIGFPYCRIFKVYGT